MIRIAAGFFAAAAAASLHSQAATFSINQIDYVDPVTHAVAASTTLWGNNNNGKVIGVADMTDPSAGTNPFSFVYDPATGNFTPIAPPPGIPASRVAAISINDDDDIAGTIFDPAGQYGFILRAGTYTFFTEPGWPNTTARTMGRRTALHPQGLVVGFSQVLDATTGASVATTGYIYDPVANTFFDIPGTASTFSIAQGLNVAGQVVGHVVGSPPLGFQGFLYTPTGPDPMAGGTTSTFTIDGFRTRARGINDHGILAAAVNDGVGIHTYVATSSGFQLVDIPSAVGPACPDGNVPSAFPEGLNNSSQVTGILTDNSGSCLTHGFIATPAYVPSGTTPSGAYTFTIDVVPNTPYFLDPATAIGYDYQVGRKDPRFASVRLPLGIGDNKFVLVVDHKAYDLNAGQLFDFRAHGFRKGVKGFRVACIDPAGMLDPVNSLAFPTEVTFAAAGTFTGTQLPLTHIKFKGKDLAGMSQADCRSRMLGKHDNDGPDAD